MKRKLSLLGAVVLVLAVAGCSKPGNTTALGTSSGSGGVAAVVNGEQIKMEDLDSAAKKQLMRVQTEIYQVKKRALDDLIEDKLIEEAAKKKGVSVDKYLEEEVKAKITAPTDAEVESFYNASKERFGKPLEDVKKQILEYLSQGREARAKNDLMAKLKGGAQITVNLEVPRVEVSIGNVPIMGEKDAKITLVEFSDYQCPFCKKVRPTIWRLMDEYKGKIRYVFRDFPLSFHKESKKAHEAALCAGDEGKYYEFNRKIFDNQTSISVDDLKKYAKELQLNTKDFDKCLDEGKHTKDVEKSIEDGINAGVSGTPAYFINGIMLSGAMPYDSFKEIIESELKK